MVAISLTAVAIPPTFAAFSAQTQNGEPPGGTNGNRVVAAPDFRAPVVGTVAIGKAAGGVPGFVKQGGEYFVYANVAADTGAPASGTESVRANVSAITAGSTAVTLSAGSFSAGTETYGYRAGPLTASAGIAEGATAFSVTATDVAQNSNTANGSVTVDNTAPKATDVQTTNAGAAGLIEQNDTLVLSYGEPLEPGSILTGWSGAAASVVVRVNDNGLLGLPTGNDTAQVYNAANTTPLPLGTVDLGRGDYLSGLLGGNVRYGATGTPSTMTMSSVTNTITLVLGTYNSTIVVDPGRTTAAAAGTASWTPVATPYDRAANAMSTVPATEAGAADKEF